MFLDPLRIHRPDLAPEVRRIVRLVCDQPEGQSIGIAELVRMLGINVAPWLRQDLLGRGDLDLGATHFENRGPSVRRKVRLLGVAVDLSLAERLYGRILRFHDSFQLAFEPDHSVSVSKFLFSVELRHLDLSTERIFVDFAGAQDIFIDLQEGAPPLPLAPGRGLTG